MAWDDIPEWSLKVAEQLLAELKAKDPFTYMHCCRVGRGSRQLAKAIGLNQFEQAVLEYAGLFHDIGKTKIPVEILTKPGRLDRQEVEIMKSHAEESAQMIKHLEDIPFFRFMIPGVRYHHERVDGMGYPHKIKGDDIPLFARLICVVDTFDAMTNTRSYRKGLPEEKAIKELIDFSGRQFDSHMVKAFLELLPHMKKTEEDSLKEEVVVAQLLKKAA